MYRLVSCFVLLLCRRGMDRSCLSFASSRFFAESISYYCYRAWGILFAGTDLPLPLQFLQDFPHGGAGFDFIYFTQVPYAGGITMCLDILYNRVVYFCFIVFFCNHRTVKSSSRISPLSFQRRAFCQEHFFGILNFFLFDSDWLSETL